MTRATRALVGAELLAALAETPARMSTAVDQATPGALRTAPTPDEWSANEVLGHLRACADVWGGCIETILREDRPTIRAVNPRTWIEQTDYLDLEFDTSLHAFSKQRGELLAVLRGLAPEEWAREATVIGAGRPLVRTVLSYAQWVAAHERPHVKQIERVVRQLGARPGD